MPKKNKQQQYFEKTNTIKESSDRQSFNCDYKSRHKSVCNTNTMYFNEINRLNAMNDKVELKYLSNKKLSVFEPHKYCKVIDLIFLVEKLESKKCKNDFPEEKFRPFFSIINFKRIIKIMTDHNNNLNWYCLEERWMDKNPNESLKHLSTVIDYLISSDIDSTKKQSLIQKINFWAKSIVDLNVRIQTNHQSIAADVNIPLEFDNINQIILTSKESLELKGRQYYTKFDISTVKDIRSKPFFLIHKDFSEKNFNNCLKWQCCNNLFLKLTNELNLYTSGLEGGFEAFSVIYSDDWMSLYEKLIDFSLNLKQISVQQRPEELEVMKKGGSHIPGYFTQYKQVYRENPDKFIIQQYYVFTEEGMDQEKLDFKVTDNNEKPQI